MGLNTEKRMKRNQIDVGISWIDTKIVFTEIKFEKRMWLGICNYTGRVMIFAPYDFKKMTTAVTTITVEPDEKYCEKAQECVYFKCPLNRFKKESFLSLFSESSGFSLALPNDFGNSDLWFNCGKYQTFWSKVILYFNMSQEGGVLEYSEDKANSKLILP